MICLPGLDSFNKEEYKSWQSRSSAIRNVRTWNVLHLQTKSVSCTAKGVF